MDQHRANQENFFLGGGLEVAELGIPEDSSFSQCHRRDLSQGVGIGCAIEGVEINMGLQKLKSGSSSTRGM